MKFDEIFHDVTCRLKSAIKATVNIEYDNFALLLK